MAVELWAVLTAVGGPVVEMLKTGAESLIGTRFTDEMQAARARMAGHLPLPENHDLVRGIRAAHLAAVRKVATGYGRVLEALPKGEAHADERSFQALLDAWLADHQKLLSKGALDHHAVTADDVAHVLDEMVHPSTIEGFAAAALTNRAAAQTRALAEITQACAAPPPLFVPIFEGRDKAGWYDHFALFVNEELKVNTRFRAIFLAAELVDIKRLVAACDGQIAALSDRGAERLGAIETLLGSVKEDTAAIRAEMATTVDVGRLREAVEDLPHTLHLTLRDKEQLTAALAEAQAQLAGTQATVLGFLQTMVGRAVQADQLVPTLFEIARRWEDAGRRISELEQSRNLSPELSPLRERAADAHAAGDVEAAERLLADIDAKEGASLARLLAHQQEVAAEIALRRSEQARTKRARADLAFTRLDWEETARLLVEAVDLEVEKKEERFEALMGAARSFYESGHDAGVNAALEVAISLRREALPFASDPDGRGAALNHLGNALSVRGERESGTVRLEEAIATYRAALEELPRERAPLAWAITQNNLANALAAIGERESGTARLEEAIAAYRAALEEQTRERTALAWAMTQNNLGNALATIGERESGTARLEEAVAAYHAALEEHTRERVPLDWAMTQNNLGAALVTIGERETGTARLEEAVAAYRAALEERTRGRLPLGWATTQNNLGNALATISERESGTLRLEEAIAAYRAALEERTRARVPLAWAMTQNNLGTTLHTLGEREGGTARLEEAAAAYRAALEVFTPEASPHHWDAARRILSATLALIAARTGGGTGGTPPP